MNKCCALLSFLAAAWTPPAVQAQSTQPVLTKQPGNLIADAASSSDSASTLTIDLRDYFHVPEVRPPLVLFQSNLGFFVVQLFPDDAPLTVENFLRYVDGGLYNGSIIHRSVKDFVIQGGGYRMTDPAVPFLIEQIPVYPPIRLEYKLPNQRGTLAMARTSERDSATSQFFINTVDNTHTLSPINGGGYAVFGKTLGEGLDVIDKLAKVSAYNLEYTDSTGRIINKGFTHFPLLSAKFTRENLLQFTTVQRLDLYPESNQRPSLLRFHLGPKTSTGTAEISLLGSTLQVQYPLHQDASIQVEIVATSLEGKTASTIIRSATSEAAVVLGASARFFSANWYDWLGFVYDDLFPWIFLFQKKRWLYCAGPDADNLFLWSPEIGWLWTNNRNYPFVYAFEIIASDLSNPKPLSGWIELPSL